MAEHVVFAGSAPHLPQRCISKNDERRMAIVKSDTASGVMMKVVNPDTLMEVSDGVEGEFWISSPSKAIGYWGKPEKSKETFYARLKGSEESESKQFWLRTGACVVASALIPTRSILIQCVNNVM